LVYNLVSVRASSPTIRPALFVFSFWVVLFALILLNGYVLHFLHLSANPAIIFTLVLIQLAALACWLRAQKVSHHGDPLELAGFLLVTVGVWLYFVYPSWPTLLPPSHSGDGANHASEVNFIFASGRIFGDYPAGPALLSATLAHWVGWSPLRMLHLSAALWIALTAGGIFGLACAMFPDRREYKVMGLCAAFALFIPWGYFGGLLIDLSYFSVQALGQLFVVAFVWFLVESTQADHPFWLIGMALCLIAISVSFQLWLVLPLLLFAWTTIRAWRNNVRPHTSIYRAVLIVVGSTVVFWLAIFLTSRELIPDPARLNIAGAAVLAPSFQQLGGPFLFLPALGVMLIRRRGKGASVVTAFFVLAATQCLTLVAGNAWFGFSTYWMNKSFFLLIFPLALCAVVPLAQVMEFSQSRLRLDVFSSPYAFVITLCVLGAATALAYPPPVFSPLNESDLQVALWAKEHLDTLHINFISRKSLVASWLGVGIWGEQYPKDLFVDLAALGPKTFQEWRNDPDWGEYLFVSSKQQMPPDATLRVVYQSGRSAILQKASTSLSGEFSETVLGRFGDTFELVDYTRPHLAFQPGDVISLTARIRPLSVPVSHVAWRLQVRDHANNPVAESQSEPFDNKFPLQRWPDGKVLSQLLQVRLPANAAPGLNTLQLGLYPRDGEPLPFESAAHTKEDSAMLASIRVGVPSLSARELDSITYTHVQIGDSLELVGYRIPDGMALHPGGSFRIILYWRALTRVSRDYTVFVHLIDASGVIRAQRDTAPRAGSYPTSSWDRGEIVPDEYTLNVPSDAPSSVYQIELGMYDWPSLQRLVTKTGNQVLGNRVVLPLAVSVTGNK
jgi:hypothetical protein